MAISTNEEEINKFLKQKTIAETLETAKKLKRNSVLADNVHVQRWNRAE